MAAAIQGAHGNRGLEEEIEQEEVAKAPSKSQGIRAVLLGPPGAGKGVQVGSAI